MSKAFSRNPGFTLLEVTVAVLLLVSALTIILGLQNSVVQRSVDDHQRTQAMLMARRIMSAIELWEDPPEDQVVTGPPENILEFVSDVPLSHPETLESTKHMETELLIEPWNFPGLEEDMVKRIRLRLSWGAAAGQTFEVIYFIPSSGIFSGTTGQGDEGFFDDDF